MTTSDPLVSVIVVTHDRPAFLARCLDSVAAQSWARRELIVVLNPPDADSERLARQHAGKGLMTHRNLGAFPAVNLGIANSEGALIMIVDDDARFESADGLERLVLFLLRKPSVAAATCNIRGPCEPKPYAE